MHKLEKIYFKSITAINSLLFLFLIFLNLLFHIFDLYINILYYALNFLVLLLFFLFNRRFEKELNEWKEGIKILSNSDLKWKDEEIKELLYKKMFYKENDDNYKLFKNMYIRKNLIAKDFEDLKTVFLKFIPESFLDEVGRAWTEKISVWISAKKYLNIMFLDIVWFTSMTEKMEPDRALLLLNIYFDWIVELINDHWGYIDKFLWDGMMAIFEWNNSDSSINAAIDIQIFMKKFRTDEVWKRISVWIWINSWEVILWTIWSRNRMEITVIWDVVNTASRIETLTRTHVSNIMISRSTFENISNNNKFTIKNLWMKTLAWKKTKIKIYWVESIFNSKK